MSCTITTERTNSDRRLGVGVIESVSDNVCCWENTLANRTIGMIWLTKLGETWVQLKAYPLCRQQHSRQDARRCDHVRAPVWVQSQLASAPACLRVRWRVRFVTARHPGFPQPKPRAKMTHASWSRPLRCTWRRGCGSTGSLGTSTTRIRTRLVCSPSTTCLLN